MWACLSRAEAPFDALMGGQGQMTHSLWRTAQGHTWTPLMGFPPDKDELTRTYFTEKMKITVVSYILAILVIFMLLSQLKEHRNPVFRSYFGASMIISSCVFAGLSWETSHLCVCSFGLRCVGEVYRTGCWQWKNELIVPRNWERESLLHTTLWLLLQPPACMSVCVRVRFKELLLYRTTPAWVSIIRSIFLSWTFTACSQNLKPYHLQSPTTNQQTNTPTHRHTFTSLREAKHAIF